MTAVFISYARFEKSTYKKLTDASYWKVRFNTGLYGEYLIVEDLQRISGIHKTLVNMYIPKLKGEGMTEIDILLIHEKGIYVIESKNYSGWIYGKEKDYKWTQVFPNKKKFKFYNPIKQNRTHVRAIQNVLSDIPEELFASIIVFSNRCTLKSIDVTSLDIHIVNRKNLSIIQKINQTQVDNRLNVFTIYGKLMKYTNVSDQVKQEHINKIQQKYS